MNRSMRDMLVVLLLVLIMVGVLVFYVGFRPKLSLSSTSSSTPAGGVGIAISGEPAYVTETGQYYKANLEYPSQTALVGTAGTAADAAAVADMKAYDQSAVAQFKQDADIASITPQIAEDQGLNQYNKYQLTNTYQLYSSAQTISYIFTFSEDTLGAHPNSYFHTFTFDKKTGKLLALSDLFTSGSNYLSEVSSLARSTLTHQLGKAADASFIDPGTTPIDSNFQNFALTGGNLVFFFAAYQVAPYSSGPQVVYLPANQLTSLKPAYQ